MFVDVNKTEERYTAHVEESSHTLSPKQALIMCDMSSHSPLADCVKTGEVIPIDVAGYAVISIHNPKAKKEKNYKYFIVEDKDGKTYYTGSNSFVEQFMFFWDVMKDNMDEFQVEVFCQPSQNYETGFLTLRMK